MDPVGVVFLLIFLCGMLLIVMLCLAAGLEDCTKDHRREHEHLNRLTRIHLDQRQGQDEMEKLTREYINRFKK